MARGLRQRPHQVMQDPGAIAKEEEKDQGRDFSK